jgi:DNA-binding PadR family transcriptional regulator
MEKRGWIEAEWGTSELGRRAKFYRLTRKGRQQLASDTEAWAAFALAVNRVLVSS